MFSFRTTPLEDQLDKALIYGKVGYFCTQNCWDTAINNYRYEIFRERGNLETIFTPKEAELTPGTNHIDFAPEQLENLSAVVVEIQDAGVRYFNYTKDVFRLMEVLNEIEYPPAFYVVDHLNPAGRVVEGTMPKGDYDEHMPKIAHRHGLTLGELCDLFYVEIGAKFPMHIISATASESNKLLLPWSIPPTSDMPGMFSSYMYSGGGLWNNTTITPGIGTARPYEYIGAPFIKHAKYDNPPVPQGVMMRPCSFTPSCGRYQDERCYGYQIMIEPGVEYHSLLHTLQLMKYFSGRYSQFSYLPAFAKKLADPEIVKYLDGFMDLRELSEYIKLEEQKWMRKTRRYTLYDTKTYRMK